MKMLTPPECAGQTVEVGYGWHDGSLYRRRHDRSDGSVAWSHADQDDADALPEGWTPVNGSPRGIRWTPCDAPIGGAS